MPLSEDRREPDAAVQIESEKQGVRRQWSAPLVIISRVGSGTNNKVSDYNPEGHASGTTAIS